MDEQVGFTRAICLEPEEDTPRLAFADWLEERDRPERAEFIRTQIAIARLPGEEQCPQCYAAHFGQQRTNGPCRCSNRLRSLRTRERELFRDNLVWSGWVHSPPRRDVLRPADLRGCGKLVGCLFMRGLPERMDMPIATFLGHAAAIFARHPVREIRLTDKEPTGGMSVMWCRDGALTSLTDPWGLPAELFDRLGGFTRASPGDGFARPARYYHSEAAALAALSCACVAFGRHAAGLTEGASERVAG